MPGPSENAPGTTMVTFVTATIDPRGWLLRISSCRTWRWPLIRIFFGFRGNKFHC
jgi:hypothetical protein